MMILMLILIPIAITAAAEDQPPLRSKFHVEGTILAYDTETGLDDGEITPGDSDSLLAVLRDNPAVTTLRLNSAGGSIWAAEDMARIVIDFDLDTVVDGVCSSSCVTVFLGGKARHMTRGSKIGLHSRWWASEDVQDYYERNKDEEHWVTPFDFGSWIYEDTQAEIYAALSYIVTRRLEPGFAIEMYAPRDRMWYPARSELEAASVLRD